MTTRETPASRRAWPGAYGVIARFQGDDGSGSPGSVASLMQCLYLGV